MPAAGGADEPFRVLFVCTANMCRSPLAEQIFHEELGRSGGGSSRWSVGSGGTHAQPGTEVHDLVRVVMEERGRPIPVTPCHQLTETDIGEADLILTAGRTHRAWIVERAPAAVRRTFTLRQFARQCAAGPMPSGPGVHDAPSVGRLLVERASVGRRRLQPVAEDEDLIDDPIGGGLEEFRVCAEQISEAVRQVLRPDGR